MCCFYTCEVSPIPILSTEVRYKKKTHFFFNVSHCGTKHCSTSATVFFFLDVSQNNNRVITFIEVWVWTSLRSVAPAEKQTNKFDCNLNVLFYPSCMCLKCGRKPSDPKKKNLKHRSGSLFHPQVHPKREYKTAHYTQLEDHEGTETNHWRTVLFKSPVLWFVCVVRNSRVAVKQHSNDTFFSPVDSILGNTKIHVSCTYKVKKKYN